MAGAENTLQTISVIRAAQSDSKDVWEWRNDEFSRRMSITTDPIAWETHRVWFENSLADPNRYLFIACIDNERAGAGVEKAGICRFDLDPEKKIAEVSINLNPRYRNKRLSAQILSAAIETFAQTHKVDLLATIRTTNTGSIKCFTQCGFKLASEDCDYALFKKPQS